MFGAASRGAARRYQTVDVASRVEGATPHGRVVILFEELLKALDAAIAAEGRGDPARRRERQIRAIGILHGLETGLDFERGGEIAANLGKIYREARRLISLERPGGIAEARAMIADIAGAWAEIA